MASLEVEIDYTNHRGERRKRVVQPLSIAYVRSPFHDGEQWILSAVDVGSNKVKHFAMKHVHAWVPIDEQAQVAEPDNGGA